MVEELSDKNLALGEQIEELKQKIKDMQQILDTTELIEFSSL